MFNSMKTNPPPKGSKFVVIYDDGSGADLFMRDDNGDYLDAEQGCPDTMYHSCFWMPIPDDFKFWFENHPDA